MGLMRSLTALAAATLLAACASQPEDIDKSMPLGTLVPIEVSPTTNIVRVSTDDQIATYKSLLSHVDSKDTTRQIMARVADLELLLQDQLVARSEQAVSEDPDAQLYMPDYSVAIAAYEAVLNRFPGHPENDLIYYQLAKAHDLNGDSKGGLDALTKLVTEYPQSRFVVESQFRRGDYLYSLNKYRGAELAYAAVLEKGQNTPFYENAIYMQGWSQFKLSKYDEALVNFVQVLDRIVPPSGDLEATEKSKRTLAEDSIRISAVILGYIDGAQSLEALIAKVGPRAYEDVLYEELGELYVDQERYQDAIDTYRAFLAKDPRSQDAPRFSVRILETMQKARFYKQMFAEKELFVENYNTQSGYYFSASDETRAFLDDYLYAYLDELSRYYHARAQKARKAVAWYKSAPKAKKDDMQQKYAKAIGYYDAFIVSFPDDMHAAEKSFMQAEAYAEQGDLANAVKGYERTAYDFALNDYSEEAAYAAIIGYRKLMQREKDKDVKLAIRKQKLNAQIAFGENFAFSQYGRAVLLDTIDTLYQEKLYEDAIKQSEIFLTLKPEGTPKEKLTISLVMGHSSFELGKYADAENYYRQSLALLGRKDRRYAQVFDRTTASIYKQGEALADSDKKLEAVEQFLRVGEFAPNSKYRKAADYDAATYLLQAEEWDRALSVLTDYRSRYDKRKTDLDITGKLIAIYEGQDRLDLAAAELKRVFRDEKDPDKRRQALYLSAEYYERADKDDLALDAYRSYAHSYPEPFDLAMENRFRLSEMYAKRKDDNRRRYWLEKIIIEDKRAGDKRTPRSKYLAAYSRNVFADDYRKAFEKISLKQPLDKSLPKKQKAMEAALKRYQWVSDYNIQEFTTLATYQVAQIYKRMAKDVMDSERPAGWDELELEQYEYILEEQAYPLEDQSVAIHEANVERSWNGNYDEWVGESMKALGEIMPARYNKPEVTGGYREVVY